MSLPKQVSVGPFAYRVSDDKADWKKYVSKADRDDCWGYTNHSNAIIMLSQKQGMNPTLARVTLLHEVLHACAFAGGVLDTAKRREEVWVSLVAPMLLDSLARSPGLVEFLRGDEGK